MGSSKYVAADLVDLDGDGDMNEPLPFDLHGDPRSQGIGSDMGAFESPIVYTINTETPGVNREIKGPHVEVFPNPANSLLIIHLQLPFSGPLSITVYYALRQRVRTIHNGSKSLGHHFYEIDTFGMPSGVYFIRVITDEHSKIHRLVVH